MDKNTINKIFHLNNKFYNDVADEFHSTRNQPWEGWSKLVKIINDNFHQEIKILDMGCGNGRFIDVLSKIKVDYNYSGLDNNTRLLEIAGKKYTGTNVNFINIDVFNELDKINSTYDVIVLFGITHHIPSRELRVDWFKNIARLLNPGGLFIFTIWNIHKDERSEKLTDNIDEFEPQELEYGDKFYGWGDSNVYRYVHIYSEDELDEIVTALNSENLHLIDKFEHDGKALNLNAYFVLRKSK